MIRGETSAITIHVKPDIDRAPASHITSLSLSLARTSIVNDMDVSKLARR